MEEGSDDHVHSLSILRNQFRSRHASWTWTKKAVLAARVQVVQVKLNKHGANMRGFVAESYIFVFVWF